MILNLLMIMKKSSKLQNKNNIIKHGRQFQRISMWGRNSVFPYCQNPCLNGRGDQKGLKERATLWFLAPFQRASLEFTIYDFDCSFIKGFKQNTWS